LLGQAEQDHSLRFVIPFAGFLITEAIASFTAGGKSLHFHFIFDTRHLTAVPFDASLASRWENRLKHAAIVANAHARYWDYIHDLLKEGLSPSMETDRGLRSAVQWRRFPWGHRRHEETSKLFGFAVGTIVPQLVIAERILARAPDDSTEPLLSAHFDLANPISSSTKHRAKIAPVTNSSALLDEMQALCSGEWGEYPKPVRFDLVDKAIYFRNNESDQNPSTFVKGGYRKLVINGESNFDRDYFLPDGLTAEQLLDHLALRVGLVTEQSPLVASTQQSDAETLTPFERLKLVSNRNKGRHFAQIFAAQEERNFSLTTFGQSADEIKSSYRKKIANTVSGLRYMANDYLIISDEGAGKTTAHLGHLMSEAFDTALSSDDGVARFNCVASRSLEQAEEKCAEFSGYDTGLAATGVVLRSFSRLYSKACDAQGQTAYKLSDFDSVTPLAMYRQIRDEQPEVYQALETYRLNWNRVPFNGGSTMLFTSNAMIRCWHQSVMTRVFHHPDFCPDADDQDIDELRKSFAISRVVYDEIHIDELIYKIPEDVHANIARFQKEYPNWRNRRPADRDRIYRAHRPLVPSLQTLEEFDDLMRLNLDSLVRVEVDYDVYRFGNGTKGTNIYHRTDGQAYYLAFRQWLASPPFDLAFLTTETLPAVVLQAAYSHFGRSLVTAKLDGAKGIYPIKVRQTLDGRANSRQIRELAQECLSKDATAIVIGNKLDAIDRTFNFDTMKGRNDLRKNNIVIIPTMLSPQHYGQLNVIGQWLKIPDIIPMHYEDQICQAVGRNQGFRTEGFKVEVITGKKLSSTLLSRLNGTSRVRLYRE
jgi:hypothetical protein